MNQPPPYNINDLLILLGQCTYELAVLRARVAQLEAQQAVEQSPNGVAEVVHANAE